MSATQFIYNFRIHAQVSSYFIYSKPIRFLSCFCVFSKRVSAFRYKNVFLFDFRVQFTFSSSGVLLGCSEVLLLYLHRDTGVNTHNTCLNTVKPTELLEISSLNGAQNCSKGQVFHSDTREVEERLQPRMYRPCGGGDAAWGADGAAVLRGKQRREPQERRHGEEGGHVPSDPPPGPATALHFLHKQTPGAAV